MSPLYPRLIAVAGAGGAASSALPPVTRLRGLRLLQIGCWLGTFVLLRLVAGRVLGPSVRGLLLWPALWALWVAAATGPDAAICARALNASRR